MLNLNNDEKLTNQINADLDNIEQDCLNFIQLASITTSTTKNSLGKTRKKEFLSHYFMPWGKDRFAEHEGEHIKTTQREIIDKYVAYLGWGANKRPYPSSWMQKIVDNIDTAALYNLKITIKTGFQAVITHDTSLRELPTDKPSYKNWTEPGQGPPFDHLQTALVPINTPVYTLYTTKDKAWQLVITGTYSFGWISSLDMALVDDSFMKAWKTENYIAPIVEHMPICEVTSGMYLTPSKIGRLFPMQGKPLPGKKNTQKTYYSILVAITNPSSGYSTAVTAQIDTKHAVPIPYIPTPQNIALIGNQVMGEPYGWGGTRQYRDCSALMRDIFTPFAQWLPERSTDQGHAGTFVALDHLEDTVKERYIIEKAIPFHTLLWQPGHIVLYIGQKDKKAYIFHAGWGLGTKQWFTKQKERALIGKSVVMPLDFGKSYTRIPQTLLSKTKGMALLDELSD